MVRRNQRAILGGIDMADLHILSRLRVMRAELHDELRQIEQRANKLRADLDVLDRAMLLLTLTVQPIERTGAAEIGKRGGEARARSLTAERRSEIAKLAATKRWTP
jgi:hypothetical protein